MRFLIGSVTALLCIASSLQADTVHLKTGQKIRSCHIESFEKGVFVFKVFKGFGTAPGAGVTTMTVETLKVPASNTRTIAFAEDAPYQPDNDFEITTKTGEVIRATLTEFKDGKLVFNSDQSIKPAAIKSIRRPKPKEPDQK